MGLHLQFCLRRRAVLAAKPLFAGPRITHSPHIPPTSISSNMFQGVLLLFLYACRYSEHHREVAAAHKLRAAG